MNCVLLSIGDELVLGQTVDTNSAWLSGRLMERGVMPLYHLTVPDDRPAIAAAIREAARAAKLVIVTGGLGPTDDDLTRQGLADAMGVELVTDELALRQVREWFTRRQRPMVGRNAVQALAPRGSTILENPTGTAPGLCATLAGSTVLSFPGVPRELFAMFELHVEPLLQSIEAAGARPRTILTHKINTFGEGESRVAELLGELMARDRNPVVGTTVSRGVVSVRIRSDFPSRPLAQQHLDDTAREIRRRLGPLVYGDDDTTLAHVVIDLLRQRRKTLALAESCTGGLIGTELTEIPGASDALLGGWIVYSNQLKNEQLGVSLDVLQQHGAVSEPVALALAEGARLRARSDFALAVTGIAGPGGGTPDKPVGTVWIALADATHPTLAQRFIMPGDRHTIRDRSAKTALNMLRLRLSGER